MSGKCVEIICPNARRQKIKTNPAMTVLQILQQVCKKQGFDYNNYDLKYQKKVLNVTSMIRFLNLTNNAKLEMIKCEKPRTASDVTVALQTEDSSRLQHEFNPNTSLLDILKCFQDKSGNTYVRPEAVCVYTRNEYKSIATLTKTTLKSMGITSGRAAIRLLFRDIEENTNETIVDKQVKDTHSTEPAEKKIKLIDTSVHSPHVSQQEYSNNHSGPTHYPPVACGAPPSQIFPDETLNQPQEIFPQELSYEEPLECIQVTPAVNEFVNFKFPEKSQDDEDIAIDPDVIRTEVRLSMPCEREPIIYSLESLTSVSSEEMNKEPDDNFFQVTVDDLQKRLTELNANRKELIGGSWMTKSMRERKEIEKLAGFEKIPIRFQFPDKTVLQAFFGPLEKVSSICEFLKLYISEDIKGYELFTTPPKHVLNDKNITLYKAKLFPAALVYISASHSSSYIKSDHLENIRTYQEAEGLLQKNVARKGKASTNLTSKQQGSSCHRSSQNQATGISTKTTAKAVPKWFKTGR